MSNSSSDYEDTDFQDDFDDDLDNSDDDLDNSAETEN